MCCVPSGGCQSVPRRGRFQPLLQELPLVSQDDCHYDLLYFTKHRLARLLAAFFFFNNFFFNN